MAKLSENNVFIQPEIDSGRIWGVICSVSIYQQFNNAIRGSHKGIFFVVYEKLLNNYFIDAALQYYYQRANQKPAKPLKLKSKDFIPIEGVSIAIHNRNNMHV